MVEVIMPQKNETILDPACGTAGFLISSYKHILKDNTKKIPGDLLTPDERKKLLANFRGYDISPDMVRLSLVNLYLHGFVQPQIMEYDTLTSEDRWNEYADVILANPPFMSPKGGIKPHKKFSVQSNRSEVLFVDYIAEHLKPTGRAAVIVPEGIIFQSAGAYKQLRKMLVENYLYAVASLPAGVFNPYSGVKTSILFMDKSIAKKVDSILFVKIENDGYGLGAQRWEQTGSDLPEAVNAIADYVKVVRGGKQYSAENGGVLLVSKEKLAENSEYNLTGDRYRIIERRGHQKWPMVRLGEVCEINPSKVDVKNLPEDYEVSFVTMEDLKEFRTDFTPSKSRKLGEVLKSYTYFRDGDVILARVTPCFENGKAGIAKGLTNGIGFGSSEYFVFRAGEPILPGYIYRVLMNDHFRENGIVSTTGTGGLQRVTVDFVKTYRIPLPPLSVQHEIVAEIEGYQKLIDGCKELIALYEAKIKKVIDKVWEE
jgi:type I restriction enzyme M protein